MHWQQGGERKVEKSCIASLEPITVVKGELVHFFCIFGFWSVQLKKTGWTGFGNRCDLFWSETLKKTGWTGFGNRCDRFWLLSMHKSRGSVLWLRGSCICAGGNSFVSFAWVASVVRTMCGSRTSGGSLPGVMSD
jgi:hypothetical protein